MRGSAVFKEMRRLYWLLVLALVSQSVRAQYDAAMTNYWSLQSYFNPAASGIEGKLDIQGVYSMQMTGYDNAPATMLATADLPLFFLSPRHGVGLGFMNDDIGLFSNKKLYLQYAYHIPLWKGHLSIGARVGVLNETFDGSDLDVEDSGDPAFPTSEVDGTAFDLDFGLRYTRKGKWYAGISSMHLTAPTIALGDEKDYETEVSRLYYLTGGYTFMFRNPQFGLAATTIVRTDFDAWRGDITARLLMNTDKLKMYAGLSYSPTISVALLVGTTFHGVKIGYSYEMYTGGVGVLNGTHEIVVGYQMDLNMFKKGKNLHKSLRIL